MADLVRHGSSLGGPEPLDADHQAAGPDAQSSRDTVLCGLFGRRQHDGGRGQPPVPHLAAERGQVTGC